ncbi:MAG: hypothetical protein L0216_03125 [Planctomycetales bacterium]|nr:hypothetical protein [Planctomycetales bacterium]
MAEDYRKAALDAPTRALCDYAVKVTRAPWTVADEDVEGLRRHGFSDTAIFEATHVIGYFNHINRLADALHVDLEPEMPPAPAAPAPEASASLGDFQSRIQAIFGERDGRRGIPRNFMWFTEEVGELSRALVREGPAEREKEFADVLAWLCSLATLSGVDLAAAAWRRYGDGCPRCRATPCACPPAPGDTR